MMKHAYIAPSNTVDQFPAEVQEVRRHTDPRAASIVFDDYDDITLWDDLPQLPAGAQSLWMESPVDDELSTWTPTGNGWYMNSATKNVRYSKDLVVGAWED